MTPTINDEMVERTKPNVSRAHKNPPLAGRPTKQRESGRPALYNSARELRACEPFYKKKDEAKIKIGFNGVQSSAAQVNR